MRQTDRNRTGQTQIALRRTDRNRTGPTPIDLVNHLPERIVRHRPNLHRISGQNRTNVRSQTGSHRSHRLLHQTKCRSLRRRTRQYRLNARSHKLLRKGNGTKSKSGNSNSSKKTSKTRRTSKNLRRTNSGI